MEPSRRGHARRRQLAAMFALAGLAGLAACGGGVSIGIGLGELDEPPQVSLTAAVDGAAVGEVVRLVAAAVDDWGVEYVRLYRVDDNGDWVGVGVDGSAPYRWDIALPPAASGRVRFIARAVDGAGQAADSNLVEIVLR